MKEPFYVTTPIYYVNDVPHIGHAYTTLAADVLARFKRLMGYDVFFLTGTDEHGQKVELAAQKAGEEPLAFVSRVMTRFQELWSAMNISYDDFIRTTDQRHRTGVASLFEKLRQQGDIYLGEYEGWYCTPCETFWTETQLNDGKCPDCNRATERLKEDSYFFRMSKYQDAILAHIESHPDFILPRSRRNEIISFVKEGLRDLSISRTTFNWGIPVPGDERHVIYVWFDALTNYLTALGYPEDASRVARFWPANVQLIGKDILRFHAVYWPAFLLAAGLPLPEKVFAHGWWTVEGAKISKSLGNAIDPAQLIKRYGVDQVRYFLLREVPFGLDGDYSRTAMENRINYDLANDLGNLLSRTTAMAIKYFDGTLAKPGKEEEADRALRHACEALIPTVSRQMDELAFSAALQSIWELVSTCNKYVAATEPWSLAKEPGQRDRLATVIYYALETQRIVQCLLSAFMPASAQKALDQLGCIPPEGPEALTWGGLKEGGTIHKGEPLFPRIS